MSLRTRLLLSHLLLLAVTLTVMALALSFLLSRQPAPAGQTYQRLAAVAQTLPLRDLVLGSGTLRSTPQERIAAISDDLDALATERSVRILVTDMQDGTTLYDSGDTFSTSNRLTIKRDSYAIPPPLQRGFAPRTETVFGSFTDAGEEWLFMGLALQTRSGSPGGAILFAEPRDNGATLSEFALVLARPLVQAAVVGLIVAAAAAAAVSRTIARSLDVLATATSNMAKGNYSERVPVTGPREVRAAAEAFNLMAAEVEAAQAVQQDFLANVSHDLKTPLTSIQGYSQAIIDGAAADPIRAARIIHEEAARLNRMVIELTDLARLEAGRLSLRMTALDLGQIVAAVGQRLLIVAHEKGIQLHVDASPMPEVAGDGDRMVQVLTNLISNAVKYTPAGGEVWVATRATRGGVEISVRDTGIGIPADELPRIFERFYQVDKARGPERGTGLGLAIVREIVQAHGGSIEAHSDGRNTGSTFIIRLPTLQMSTIIRGGRRSG